MMRRVELGNGSLYVRLADGTEVIMRPFERAFPLIVLLPKPQPDPPPAFTPLPPWPYRIRIAA